MDTPDQLCLAYEIIAPHATCHVSIEIIRSFSRALRVSRGVEVDTPAKSLSPRYKSCSDNLLYVRPDENTQ